MMKQVMLVAAIMLLAAGCRSKAPKTSCTYGNDIPAATQDELIEVGDILIQKFEHRDYKGIYEAASSLLKSRQTREQFATILRVAEDNFGVAESSQMEELYWMNSQAREAEAMIPCNLGAPGMQDVHLVPANQELACLIYKSHGSSEWLRVVMHLIKEEGKWKLLSIAVNPSTAKGQDAEYYFKAARVSREQNHLHLAALQYQLAIILSELGPMVQEMTVSQLTAEKQQIRVDYLPQGSVQIWTTPAGRSFNVSNLGVVSAQNKLWVDLVYQAKSLADTAGLEADGKELAKFLDQKFPEYREAFDGIVVSAVGTAPADAYKLYRVIVPFSELPPLPAKP